MQWCCYCIQFSITPFLCLQTMIGILINAVIYMTPLATLDTFMVKRYCGADPAEWEEHRQHWIQSTRALPYQPPTVFELFYQVYSCCLLMNTVKPGNKDHPWDQKCVLFVDRSSSFPGHSTWDMKGLSWLSVVFVVFISRGLRFQVSLYNSVFLKHFTSLQIKTCSDWKWKS